MVAWQSSKASQLDLSGGLSRADAKFQWQAVVERLSPNRFCCKTKFLNNGYFILDALSRNGMTPDTLNKAGSSSLKPHNHGDWRLRRNVLINWPYLTTVARLSIPFLSLHYSYEIFNTNLTIMIKRITSKNHRNRPVKARDNHRCSMLMHKITSDHRMIVSLRLRRRCRRIKLLHKVVFYSKRTSNAE